MILLGRILFLIALMTSAGQALAQSQAAAERTLMEVSQTVDRVDAGLDSAREEEELSDLRLSLQDARIQLLDLQTTLERQGEQVASDLEALGPVPESGNEPDGVARLRADYLDRQASITEDVALSNALLQRIERMQESSARRLRSAFYSRILARAPPAYLPATVSAALDEAEQGLADSTQHFSQWTGQLRERGAIGHTVAAWIGALFGLFVLLVPVRDFLAANLWRHIPHEEASLPTRSAVAFTRASTRIALAAFGLFVLYRVAVDTGLAAGADAAKPRQILFAFFLFAAINAVSMAAYSPRKPHWRLTELTDEQAKRAHSLALLAGAFYALDQTLRALWGAADGPSALLRLETLVAALIFAVIVMLFRQRLPKQRRIVALMFAAFALAPLASCLLGYTSLARFLIERTAQIAVFIGYFYLIRAVAQSWLRLAVTRIALGEQADREDEQDDMVAFWTGASIDILLIAAALPLALAIAGMNWSEILALSLSLLGGFTIGNLTISPSNIVYALVLILAILLGTRITQRVLDRRILPMARVNPGIRHSFKTLIGYVGLVIAIFVGVSAIGFDLSSLALIAGALSVGIGFGLQSIVNNFVSGLILLIERPIKIGDWVITASGEGIVKRINVRSTEIETFDRCSIIVPNSELISSTVQNWTHRDNMARVRVPIGVSYKSDPDKVRSVLMQVCSDYDALMRNPEPFVYFEAFADSSLNFEVRAFIREANTALVVRDELRHRIFKALAEAGIEIPFPQRVLHMEGARSAQDDPAGSDN